MKLWTKVSKISIYVRDCYYNKVTTYSCATGQHFLYHKHCTYYMLYLVVHIGTDPLIGVANISVLCWFLFVLHIHSMNHKPCIVINFIKYLRPLLRACNNRVITDPMQDPIHDTCRHYTNNLNCCMSTAKNTHFFCSSTWM